MLYDVDNSYNINKFFCDEILKLLSDGVSAENILVITQNSYKKSEFLKELEKITNQNIRTLTFNGLVYNTINDSKNFLLDKIPQINLVGMETSQYIFKEAIKETGFDDYFSKINLLHQFFRRNTILVQNDLTEEEQKERAKILNDVYYNESQKVLNFFKKKTIECSGFDYIRQLNIFKYLYQNTDALSWIKYLFISDFDEYTPFAYTFLEHLKPQLIKYFISFDKKGSSRCGYLSARKNPHIYLTQIFNEEIKTLPSNSKFYNIANEICDAIKNNTKINSNNFDIFQSSRRYEMAENIIHKIEILKNNRIKNSDIAIITPKCDENLKYLLNSNKQEKNTFNFISGNTKLYDD